MFLSRDLRVKLKFFYFNSKLLRNPPLFSLLIHWILASTFLTPFPDILKMFSNPLSSSFLKNFLNPFYVPSTVPVVGLQLRKSLHLLGALIPGRNMKGNNTVGTCRVLYLPCVVPVRPQGSPSVQLRKQGLREVQEFAFYVEYDETTCRRTTNGQ